MKHVFVGMSGGVDSSVTAALLVEQGCQVTGVFMKNWAQDLPGFKCPWREDLADAKKVAVQLGIDFKMYDFQDQYKQKVVDHMIEQYKAGQTPNPDIMCNQEVKFKLFLETALDDGADMIATGHYARIVAQTDDEENLQLQQAVDANKDQTYFLYRMQASALSKTLFPLGGMTKPEVRKKAADLDLVTATKKDSVGICFVGEIGIKEFLQNFVEAEEGNIVDSGTGKIVGSHEGALFYTIGQRHGLGVGGGLPYYVVGKDMRTNTVFVSSDLNNPDIWQRVITITSQHWIHQPPHITDNLTVRIRHRGPLIPIKVIKHNGDQLEITLSEEVRAVAPGQSAVLYQDDICLGGGILI